MLEKLRKVRRYAECSCQVDSTDAERSRFLSHDRNVSTASTAACRSCSENHRHVRRRAEAGKYLGLALKFGIAGVLPTGRLGET
jgi:hypothetical protein